MTDLRTAAQAVIDIWNDPSLAIEPAIEALRQALQAEPELVAVRLFDTQWVNIVNHNNAYEDWDKTDAINHAVKMTERLIAENVLQGKLPHTTPPSVDALIAEIDALDRHGDDADFIYGWDINPILDKYRGVK